MIERRFNGPWVTERRTRAGHSSMSLAANLGVSVATVRSIEGSVSVGRYEAGLLFRLADALGCTIDDVVESTDTPIVELDDVGRVVSLIVAAGGTAHCDALADALDWTPERCQAVLRAAAGPLSQVGVALAWHGDVAVALVASAQADAPVEAIAYRSVELRGLTESQARVLAKVIRAGKLSRAEDPSAAGVLRNAGLVEPAGNHTQSRNVTHGVRAALRLTSAGRFNLCID